MKRIAMLLWFLSGCAYGMTPQEIYEKTKRSIVVVACMKDGKLATGGTGVIVSRSAIITANHLVMDGCKMIVKFHDTTEIEVSSITRDVKNDLAKLTIPVSDDAASIMRMVPLRLNPKLPELAETVYSVGHPDGLGWTLSIGYMMFPFVRTISVQGTEYQMLQVALDAYPGSSGAPLIDRNGDVRGIFSALLNGTRFTYVVPAKEVCGTLMKCKAEQ